MIGKNNPLNIRYNPLNRWIGQTGSTRGFCDFESVEYCIRAVAYLLIRSYPKRGCHTIGELISRYAPPSENNTQKYIEFVCNGCGGMLPFDVPKSLIDYSNMILSIYLFEGNSDKADSFYPFMHKVNYVLHKYFGL